MATHPQGKDSKTLGINMKIARVDELTLRADALGVSAGAFARKVVYDFLDSGEPIKMTETKESIKAIKARVAKGEKPAPRQTGRYSGKK